MSILAVINKNFSSLLFLLVNISSKRQRVRKVFLNKRPLKGERRKADKVNIGVITEVRDKGCYIKREISKAYFIYYLTMLNKYNGIESEEY